MYTLIDGKLYGQFDKNKSFVFYILNLIEKERLVGQTRECFNNNQEIFNSTCEDLFNVLSNPLEKIKFINKVSVYVGNVRKTSYLNQLLNML